MNLLEDPDILAFFSTTNISSMHTPEKGNKGDTKTPLDLSTDAYAQSASPLFTVLPPEIRTEIFSLALSSFPDPSNPYSFDSYWYRPGYTAVRLTHVSLLATCKRINDEARDLVWKPGNGNDEESFWWGPNNMRPPEYGVYEGSARSDTSCDQHNGYGPGEGGMGGPEGGGDLVAEELIAEWGNSDLDRQGPWNFGDDVGVDDDLSGTWEDGELADGPPDAVGGFDEECGCSIPGDGYSWEWEHDVSGDAVNAERGSDDYGDESGDKRGNPSDDDFTRQEDSDIRPQEGAESYDRDPVSSPRIEHDPREHHIEQFLTSLEDFDEFHWDGPCQSDRQNAFIASHWSRIRSIHIFAQTCSFSRQAFIRTFSQAYGLRPRTIKVTIRYTDWWKWEENAGLSLAFVVPSVDAYYFPESVDTLILELESAEHKKSELEGMAKQVLNEQMRWRWKRLDDAYLELDEDAGVKEWSWMGTTTFKGQSFTHHPEGGTMKYLVKVLTFTAKPTEAQWDGMPFERALAVKDYEASLKGS
ncbi:hypothetical protein BKA70DRAFT_1350024 [Coprinopsis sp. MPI-PUGE-AT-0042]|nr:hypothetical protein BKA70DRAFT_1350024 [Coprinopsis sp. MPI-PUGE-AT-0042]